MVGVVFFVYCGDLLQCWWCCGLDVKVVEDVFGCGMFFEDCCYYQVGIMDYVVIGEDFWVVGLVFELCLCWSYYVVLVVGGDFEVFELWCWIWLEVEGDQYGFCWDDFFGIGDWFGVVVVVGVWFVEMGFDYFYVFYLVFVDDGDGLVVEEEFYVFFFGVFYFFV